MPQNDRGRALAGARTSGVGHADRRDTPNPTTTHPTESSIAAAWVVRHFGLTPRRATLVAALAGLEGGAQ
jgi:hypothetical protein